MCPTLQTRPNNRSEKWKRNISIIHIYWEGNLKKFTGHYPLMWLLSVKDPSSRIMRCHLKFSEYDYEVTYKPGSINTNAVTLTLLGKVIIFIDFSLCSPDIFWYLSCRTVSEPRDGSDHILIIITDKINSFTHITIYSVNPDTALINHCSFNFNQANWSSFSLQVQNSIASFTTENSSIIAYSSLTSMINNSSESSIPQKNLTSILALPHLHWLNSSCTDAASVAYVNHLLIQHFRAPLSRRPLYINVIL